ncbi:hypothetical protein EAD96_05190 [Micromonospora sp. BL1]|uniref:hypothetical protein n=1 Tax=Micromonospora sp. BL1 TaxID=2478709 RepID=UPI000EF5D399|nr:hypothetical protein [Micromonospora sp. BL1]RLQ08172.1 hypothetical protein EAD96_05190 [Micromonospora sp. BL1]
MATAKKNTIPTPVEALAQARALVAEREAEHEQAEHSAAELFARLDSGDASVTGLDLATAEAEIKRTAHLLGMARKRIPAAERAVKLFEGQTNPVLAEYLRSVIEVNRFNFGMFGVPVEVVSQRPEKLTAPAAYLYQTEGVDYDTATGRMTGTVHLLVTVPADGLDTIKEACVAGIYKLVHHAGHAEVRDSVTTGPDHFVLSVFLKNLEPLMPVIEEQSSATGIGLAQQLGGLAATRSKEYVVDPRTDRLANIHTIMYRRASGEVVSQTRDGDTVRRKVRVQFIVHGIDRHVDIPELSQFVAAGVADADGIFSPGLGRVESVKVVDQKATIFGDRQALAITAEAIMISKAAA